MAHKLSFSPVEGLLYMTPVAFAWLALAIVVFEREVIGTPTPTACVPA